MITSQSRGSTVTSQSLDRYAYVTVPGAAWLRPSSRGSMVTSQSLGRHGYVIVPGAAWLRHSPWSGMFTSQSLDRCAYVTIPGAAWLRHSPWGSMATSQFLGQHGYVTVPGAAWLRHSPWGSMATSQCTSCVPLFRNRGVLLTRWKVPCNLEHDGIETQWNINYDPLWCGGTHRKTRLHENWISIRLSFTPWNNINTQRVLARRKTDALGHHVQPSAV